MSFALEFQVKELTEENEKLRAENLTLAKINKTMSDEVCEYAKENQALREELEELKALWSPTGEQLFYAYTRKKKEILKLRELVKDAIVIFDNDYYAKEEEWLEKAKEVLGE